ncbi:hypothetical protein Agub_g7299 [Astrephomene gubernaculifera]|uniref:Uncharacterized protein n=1 Tax=Astrephomene gubernaculifera TaxID=47775 RepID=A0AAD3HMH2_9CHLO|nr:hypothetical protein Agub_g7299 [Astrephomene gubernaculifera]
MQQQDRKLQGQDVGDSSRNRRGARGTTGCASTPAAAILFLGSLVAVSLAVAVWSSVRVVPYSPAAPRRLTITHLHETGVWVPEFDITTEQLAAAAEAVEAVTSAAGDGSPAHQHHRHQQQLLSLSSLVQPAPPTNPTAKLVLGITDSNPWRQLFPGPSDPAENAARLFSNAAAVPQPNNEGGEQGEGGAGGNTAAGEVGGVLTSLPVLGISGHEFASLFPLSGLLGKMVLPARPSAAPPVAVPPYIRKLRDESVNCSCSRGSSSGGSGASSTYEGCTADAEEVAVDSPAGTSHRAPRQRCRLLQLRLFSAAHCWGVLNITTTTIPASVSTISMAGATRDAASGASTAGASDGVRVTRLRSWSLPSPPVPLPPQQRGGGGGLKGRGRNSRAVAASSYMVRFSHVADSPFWDISLELEVEEVDEGEEGTRSDVSNSSRKGSARSADDPWVTVDLSITYLPLTPELRAVVKALPEWVAPTWIGTTYHSSYAY